MKELLEKRARVFEQARALVTKAEKEGRAMTSEEATEYEARMADVKALGETIDRSRRTAELNAELDQSIGPSRPSENRGSDLADAGLDSFLRRGVSGMNAEQRTALHVGAEGRGEAIELRVASPLSATTSGAGVETVPQGFVNNLETALLWYGGMRQSRATVLRTATGNALPWPNLNDTGNEGVLLAESAAIAQATTEMAFSSVTFNAYKYSSKLVLVPIELLQDSAFPIESVVAKALGERLGRIENKQFTTGTGSSQPRGIVVAATSAFTGAAATAVTFDELIKLEHSVDPAYRIGAEWMFNDSTASYLEQLKDNNGRPLLNESFAAIAAQLKAGQAGMPAKYTIKGYPVVINSGVADLAGGSKSVLFGDFSKYIIRDVMDIMLVRFSEVYMVNGQVGFVAFMRCDGDLVDAGTNPVKFITQHA